MKQKLLTILAISTTLFGTCVTDVDMNGNNIINTTSMQEVDLNITDLNATSNADNTVITLGDVKKLLRFYARNNSGAIVSKSISQTALAGDYFTFFGKDYGVVSSPKDGSLWMDRNIGADQICIASDDEKCYGYHLQWGRGFDGHEQITWNSSTSGTYTYGTRDTNASDYPTNNNLFELASGEDYDWLNNDSTDENETKVQERIDAWSAGYNSSTNTMGVCPTGWHIPSKSEVNSAFDIGGDVVDNADINDSVSAFNSFAKFPTAGLRSRINGSLYDAESNSFIWTSAINGTNSWSFYFSSSDAYWNNYSRANGFSVRCRKD